MATTNRTFQILTPEKASVLASARLTLKSLTQDIWGAVADMEGPASDPGRSFREGVLDAYSIGKAAEAAEAAETAIFNLLNVLSSHCGDETADSTIKEGRSQ